MARKKKTVGISLEPEYIEWLKNSGAGDTMTGSAANATIFGLSQLRLGGVSAVQKLSKEEREVIIKAAKRLDWSFAQDNGLTLAMYLSKWLVLSGAKPEQAEQLPEKVKKLSDAEAAGLVVRARGYYKSGQEMKDYISNS